MQYFAIELIPEADPKHSRRMRGTRSGLLVRPRRHAHHPPLPSILLANVQSLDNKVDELRVRSSFQRDIRDCNILCFTETWLSWYILSESVQPGFSVHRAYMHIYLSGNKGGGVCFMINYSWWDCDNIQELLLFLYEVLLFIQRRILMSCNKMQIIYLKSYNVIFWIFVLDSVSHR